MKLGRPRHRSLRAVGAVAALAAASLFEPRAAAGARWEPVTPAELTSKASPIDAEAGAEMLFWKVWVEDRLENGEIQSIREHYVRAKIYSEQAAQDWTRRSIEIPAKGARVWSVEARTIQTDGSIVEMDPHAVARETMLRVRGEQLRKVTFALPAVRPGSIVEYRYQEAYADALTEYEEFMLQADVPARSIQYYMKPLQVEGWFLRQMTFHARLEPGNVVKDGYHLIEVRDVPAFQREARMPPERQLQAWMLVYYSEHGVTTPNKFWRERAVEETRFFDDWCRPDDAMRRTAAQIVQGAASSEERLRRLVDWCRREIRLAPSADRDTLRAYHIAENRDARSTLKQRAGTAFDVDMLFGALARAAGLKARYLRVPRRSRLYFQQEMMDMRFVPSFEIAVEADGRWRCFDPQARRLPWNMVPWDEESTLALLCDGDSSQFLETPISDPAQSVRTRSGELTLDDEGTLAGRIELSLSGHWNDRIRTALEDATDSLAALREALGWQGKWIDLEDLQILRTDTDHEPFHATVRVRLASHANRAGRRMLLEPSAWWAHTDAEFGESRRRWPVEFPFAWSDRDSVRIRLPEGWKVELVESPRPVNARGVAQLVTTTREAEDGRVIEFRRTFDMGYGGSLYFPVDSYSSLKKLFDMIRDSDRTATPLVQLAGGQ